MKINLHSPIEEVQIQIIPLIDVIFCILTFFLLAALQFTRQQAINVDLPKASTGTTSPVQQRLLVTIGSDSQIYVEQQPVRLEQLAEALQSYLRTHPNGMMVLNASRSSTYNNVVQVLDEMRRVGGDRVALSTLPNSSDGPAGSSTPATPNFPLAPGSTPLPGTTPATGLNPLGTPNAIPPATSPFPLQSATPGQSLNPQIPTAPSAKTNP